MPLEISGNLETESAVRTFQQIFSLDADGVVGKATWYKIKEIYNGVKKLSELTSEGLTISETERQYESALRPGDSGVGVRTVRYYLAFLGYFLPQLPPIRLTDTFDQEMLDAVYAFQSAYGLPVDGIVGRETWNALQDAYQSTVSPLPEVTQAAGVILGANVGTTVTSWMLSLTGIESSNVFVQLLKPANFSPIVGIIGVIMLMTAKNDKKKDIGTILIGFAVLMFGMETMSSAVEPLAGNEKFTGILTMFSNPILGMLAGLVLTAVIQSSSASIGILQALSMSGTLTIGSAIPILMGENIGTAITAILSSMGASKNAKRAALMHLYFCILKTSFFMVLFYLIDAIVHFSFMTELANPFIIAMIHSIFNLSAVIIMLPISEVLVKLAMKTIPVTPDELEDVPVEKSIQILDERFLASPHFALEQCKTAAGDMAEYAREALLLGMGLVTEFHPEQAKQVENLENLVDSYEDQLGTYLVKLSSRNLSTRDSHTLSTLLHCIGDFERICDHAINLVGYAQEMAEKDLHFSAKAAPGRFHS